MEQKETFYKTVWKIALPVTLQFLLQSSFSVVDQIMTGQLGSVSVAGIGLAGKFASIFSVLVSAIAAAAGIMLAQYIGQKDEQKADRSFLVNLGMAAILALFFTIVCTAAPRQVMEIYTKDTLTCDTAAGYLQIYAVSFLPMALTTLLSAFLRCAEAAALPLAAGIAAAAVNTLLNYVLIFGKCGFPAMGITGAAIATVTAQVAGCVLTLGMFLYHRRTQRRYWQADGSREKEVRMQADGSRVKEARSCTVPRTKRGARFSSAFHMEKEERLQYLGILLPILICEFFWSLGENVYAAIYGHIGTQACAAMTLTSPVQVLMIGAMNGFAQAAGIMVGKSLGRNDYERAYREAVKLMLCGLCGSVILSVILVLVRDSYVQIYRVEESVRHITKDILLAFAVISPVKVQNMILGGGILRSGGRTKYVMYIDFIGTWLFGVPLGLLSAFLFHLPIAWVYFILSLEECVRFAISVFLFRKKGWMRSL
ncbi:MATE family efflux transporter [Marvinbryantia formatexigens]|nr:MATE family efflux transporter [Marvinbryantia formatexigens]UWO25915.1 MATE family efflux transporter [Marvinbryantia formatexigens DSM 14469]SDF42785.1 Na+-driven multidrug efflux pump [Marvinbryantia formatexigens]